MKADDSQFNELLFSEVCLNTIHNKRRMEKSVSISTRLVALMMSSLEPLNVCSQSAGL